MRYSFKIQAVNCNEDGRQLGAEAIMEVVFEKCKCYASSIGDKNNKRYHSNFAVVGFLGTWVGAVFTDANSPDGDGESTIYCFDKQ